MLFRHHTHSTAFSLVVDDFLVRYSHPSKLDHLVSCLSPLYELQVHRDLSQNTYLGYTIDYSPTSPSPCMTLSIPNYVPAMLSRLCPSGRVGHIPSHLHPTCTLPRHLIPFHPHHPSLSRGDDLDPTSSWVLALLRESARSLCPHRCLPTLLPPIQPHPTRPFCCPPSSKLRLL